MPIKKLLKTEPQSSNVQNIKGTDYEHLKRRINRICISINFPSDNYEPQKTISSIQNYLKHEKRILYSEISAYLFALDENGRGNFTANVDSLLITSINDPALEPELKECILKLYDHVQLVLYQVENLKADEEEFKNVIAKNLEPVQAKIEEKMRDTYKELYAQLIALIGIFTAMAFMIFGSISALDSVFSEVNKMPLLKVIIIACI